MKPKRIQMILPNYHYCPCGKEIEIKEGELASEWEKRYLSFLKKHKHV